MEAGEESFGHKNETVHLLYATRAQFEHEPINCTRQFTTKSFHLKGLPVLYLFTF